MFELSHLDAGYGETVVLRDVSLAVPPASVVALLGPNGAGKSTLLKVASGLLKPRAGKVLIDDLDVTEMRPFQLVEAGICHVPEGRAIFPSLSVRDNLILQVTTGEREAIDRAISVFSVLGRRLAQIAGTLSGGEQQMLALARAYISNPRIVLLDEVSIGLAPKIVDEIFAFLERLAHEGASLLLVEQYVSRALQLADYVFMLNRGRVVFAGEPSELQEEDILARYLGHDVLA